MNISTALATSILIAASSTALASTSYSPIEPSRTITTPYDEERYPADVVFWSDQRGVTEGGNNVIANGLEWIRWDVTRNLSVSSALQAFPEYRIATGKEIADLYDTFRLSENYRGELDVSWADEFEKSKSEDAQSTTYWTLYDGPRMERQNEFDDSDALSTTYWSTSGGLYDPTESRQEFMYNFGINQKVIAPWQEYTVISTQAVFKIGEDSDVNNLGLAQVSIGDGGRVISDDAVITWSNPGDFLKEITGVALVRNAVPEIDVAAAPISLALLMGLFAINRERRKKRSV